MLSELEGEIAEVKFDPFDPQSIEVAIQQFEAEIDEKASGYSGNEMVQGIIADLKEIGRDSILERAATARLEQKDD